MVLCNKALEVGLQYYSSVHGYCATKLWRWGCSTTVVCMVLCNKALEVGLQYYSSVHGTVQQSSGGGAAVLQ